ncbi:S-adenosyl-L-methionine-dependent methyltransferase [Backusella circina FSU 941]|nr:S-adenosyl-L-methionine-dependent methyltransferase [Backusella circina FSU 941]
MMVGPSQALFLHHLVKMLRPTQILEIGGFTGASAVAMGSALPLKGHLLSLELDPEPFEIAKRNVEASVLNEKIKFQLGPALDSMVELTKQTPKPQYDLIFLDANKGAYIKYYDMIMENDLLSDNGVLVADNVLLYGQVHREAGYNDPQELEASKNIKRMARKLDAFNKHVFEDPRSEVVVLPLYDGVSIIRKSDNLK